MSRGLSGYHFFSDIIVPSLVIHRKTIQIIIAVNDDEIKPRIGIMGREIMHFLSGVFRLTQHRLILRFDIEM